MFPQYLDAQILVRYLYLHSKLKFHHFVISKITLEPLPSFDITNIGNVFCITNTQECTMGESQTLQKHGSSMLTTSFQCLSDMKVHAYGLFSRYFLTIWTSYNLGLRTILEIILRIILIFFLEKFKLIPFLCVYIWPYSVKNLFLPYTPFTTPKCFATSKGRVTTRIKCFSNISVTFGWHNIIDYAKLSHTYL